MKTVAIIQARMGSTRLPGKVLADIIGKTMLQRIIERVAAAKSIDQIIVATTDAREDDTLVEYLEKTKFAAVFRGPIDDVLTRYYDCAKLYQAELIVRVTADDPLKDPQIIERAIHYFEHNPQLDYCSNTIDPSYPEGLDIEVFRFSALAQANNLAKLPSEREHVTPFIWKNPLQFKLHNFQIENFKNLKEWRWTVDHLQDLEFMNKIYQEFAGQSLVTYQEVIAWLDKNPHIAKINSGIHRNEGYQKSLAMES